MKRKNGKDEVKIDKKKGKLLFSVKMEKNEIEENEVEGSGKLGIACLKGEFEKVRKLLENENPTKRMKMKTPLHFLFKHLSLLKEEELIDFLIKKLETHFEDILIEASCYGGHIQLIELVLSKYESISVKMLNSGL